MPVVCFPSFDRSCNWKFCDPCNNNDDNDIHRIRQRRQRQVPYDPFTVVSASSASVAEEEIENSYNDNDSILNHQEEEEDPTLVPSLVLSSFSPSSSKARSFHRQTNQQQDEEESYFSWILPGQNLHRRNSLSPHTRRSISRNRLVQQQKQQQQQQQQTTGGTRRRTATSSSLSSSSSGSPSPCCHPRSHNLVVVLSNSSSTNNHIYCRRPVTLLEDVFTQVYRVCWSVQNIFENDNANSRNKNTSTTKKMGGCISTATGAAMLIENADGGEEDFHNRFLEDRVLGEGEFGVVKLVHDMKMAANSANNNMMTGNGNGATTDGTLACKVIRKGVQFKDNTLYPPLNPKILIGEVEMLRTLAGEHSCLGLVGVYETGRSIYIVTDFCGGGDLIEYISKQEEEIRTDDVSRISYQLLDAVDHCARHNIIHRDIKPENVMFVSPTPGSDMKLIDFGSGTNEVVPNGGYHTTFAGSPFYIAPELYQRTYNCASDVWSAGVTLYVLVAGYPAEKLQKAFNLLQQNDRDLRNLPNLPDDMPDSFYDMLEGLLVYKHKGRKTAGEMLDHEFVLFHKDAFSVENIMMEAAQLPLSKDGLKNKSERTRSIAIKGSISRHSTFLDYQKYERSLTTLLATLLNKKELARFVEAVHSQLAARRTARGEEEKTSSETEQRKGQTLDIIKVLDMKTILLKDEQDQVLEMIDKLPGGKMYDNFAYDVGVLHYFLDGDGQNQMGTLQSQTGSSRHARRASGTGSVSGARGSFRGSLRGSFRGKSFFQRRSSGNGSNQSGSNRFARMSLQITGDNSNSGRSKPSLSSKPSLKRSLSG
mmetsp:Transcript_53649/g.130713  ORF Transcript_53649/g.130713 Transcript_53649/m.130713 type:complete len:819 (-) Transcript_53649:1308-3764(-)